MFNDASGFDAMPLRDIDPDPVINWGMDVPARPSIAMFPIARDCATFNSDMSLDLRLLGAALRFRPRAMLIQFHDLGYQVAELKIYHFRPWE